MHVPFLDLGAQYHSIQKEIDEAIQAVIDSTAFAGGPFVEKFERDFAHAHEGVQAIGVSSGTAALHIALWALGIEPGDEVLLPTNTFIATAEAVSLCGATPVFVDNEEQYYGIDVERLQEAITERTKAVVGVHLYGQPCDLQALIEVSQEQRLLLIEDCAQAHLAEYHGKKVGTFGVCGCFSFYPGKNLGAYGEAGAVITADNDLAKTIRMLRDHGSSKKYHHRLPGHNYRMDGLQAAILKVKLSHLNDWNNRRREIAKKYQMALADTDGVILPYERDGVHHVYHLFVVRVERRNQLIHYLSDKGVGTGIHYPIPCHQQPAYEATYHRSQVLEVAESCKDQLLSLPMFPEMRNEQVDYVCKTIREFYEG